ncbi:MAG: DUF4168 domain-containing protein [Candidatus Binatia bacterium]
MPSYLSSRILFGVVTILIGLWSPPAQAQDSPKPSQQASTNLSDKDLRSFAKAYVEYHKLRQSYEKQISSVQDAKQKEQLQREGDAKVSKALEKQGLTPQSYNRLYTTVNNNEQLRRKALKMIEEERKNS